MAAAEVGREVDLDDILAVAKEAALLAGEQIRTAWSERGEVKDTKSNATDLVTETDQRCEDLIMCLLQRRFPEHQVIGEESAGSEKYELTDAPTWTIDPIDGTTNFVHRLPYSCVIVAFLHKKEVQVGVVYDPMGDELFWAQRGRGAFLASPRFTGPIRVSGTTSLARAVVSMDPGYGRDVAAVRRFGNAQAALLVRGVRNIRVFGSTGLNMAYVACGRLDAGFEEGSWESNLGPKIWDFAAGRLLVEEAGGVTRDLTGNLPTGEPLDVMQRSFFCAASVSLANELFCALNDAREATEQGRSVLENACKRQKT